MVVNARGRNGLSNSKDYTSMPEEDQTISLLQDEEKKQKNIFPKKFVQELQQKSKSYQSQILAFCSTLLFIILIFYFSSSSYASKPTSLQLVVFTTSRPLSFQRLLTSLLKAEYGSDRIDIDIFISPFPQKKMGRRPIDQETKKIAEAFPWTFGEKKLHIYNQSMDLTQHSLYYSAPMDDSRILFLQDNIEVSKYFWKWLKVAHNTYQGRSDLAGFSLGRIPQRRKSKGQKQTPDHLFMSPLVEHMSAYSPTKGHWKKFQDWAKDYVQRNNKSKKKYQKKGKNDLPALHLRYAFNHNDRLTVFANLPDMKTFATRYSENGSVFGKKDYEALETGFAKLLQFPAEPIVVSANGEIRYYYEHPEMFPTETEPVDVQAEREEKMKEYQEKPSGSAESKEKENQALMDDLLPVDALPADEKLEPEESQEEIPAGDESNEIAGESPYAQQDQSNSIDQVDQEPIEEESIAEDNSESLQPEAREEGTPQEIAQRKLNKKVTQKKKLRK